MALPPLLPSELLERLFPTIERVRLEAKQVLCWPNEPITHIYFRIDSMVSMLTVMQEGQAVEAGVVGHEGVVGLPLFLGDTTSPARLVCQVAGDANRVPAESLSPAAADGALRDRLLRYTQALFWQVAQSSGCNRVHPVLERCARWLLMVQDRVPNHTFHLTQEFLSQMLGVRRPSVTVVMGALQQAGLIRYHRGDVTVLNRAGLEGAACECYGIISDEYRRLLGTA